MKHFQKAEIALCSKCLDRFPLFRPLSDESTLHHLAWTARRRTLIIYTLVSALRDHLGHHRVSFLSDKASSRPRRKVCIHSTVLVCANHFYNFHHTDAGSDLRSSLAIVVLHTVVQDKLLLLCGLNSGEIKMSMENCRSA